MANEKKEKVIKFPDNLKRKQEKKADGMNGVVSHKY